MLTSLQFTPFEARNLGRGVKNVASVRQIGPGCHRLFKGRKFQGEEVTLEGPNMINLAEEGFGANVIKSVKYNNNCWVPMFRSRFLSIAVSRVANLGLVLLLVVLTLTWRG